jgi:hypothetical protein
LPEERKLTAEWNVDINMKLAYIMAVKKYWKEVYTAIIFL